MVHIFRSSSNLSSSSPTSSFITQRVAHTEYGGIIDRCKLKKISLIPPKTPNYVLVKLAIQESGMIWWILAPLPAYYQSVAIWSSEQDSTFLAVCREELAVSRLNEGHSMSRSNFTARPQYVTFCYDTSWVGKDSNHKTSYIGLFALISKWVMQRNMYVHYFK